MELKGKRVLVIGGSSGIGLGAARAAAGRGAEVVIAGRSAKRLEEAVGLLGSGATVSVRPLDVTDEAEVRTFFARESRFDHVLITAAYAYVKPLAELPLEEVRRVLEAKVVAAMNVAKHARLEAGGSLTLTAGINQARPLRGVSAVAAANGALVALGRALAVELAPVRVNVLSPGWVDTPIWAAFGERREGMLAGQAQKLPVGKVGSIEELGHAAVFLMENDFTTGTVLEVDGGHRLV
jgi:NAD(P)-dependent dehydrogenase (short-subunit alcohol dehydrogenase family)